MRPSRLVRAGARAAGVRLVNVVVETPAGAVIGIRETEKIRLFRGIQPIRGARIRAAAAARA